MSKNNENLLLVIKGANPKLIVNISYTMNQSETDSFSISVLVNGDPATQHNVAALSRISQNIFFLFRQGT
jgi:hypothetical protein